jgi:ADP-ribose pyrophosphatase
MTTTSSLTPWTKTTEHKAYKGYRSIIRKTFEMPNGKAEDFDVVDGRPFATIAAFTEEREVLIVRQYRPGPEMFNTGFPAGYIDPGESAENAARRELLEETGYECDDVVFLKRIVPAYSHVDKLCFLAIGCRKVTEPHLDENEFLESMLISLDEFKAILRDPADLAFTDIDAAYMALDRLGWI